MGGGGGDNGYEARQQAVEEQKALARKKLNAAFGEGEAPVVDRAAYTTVTPTTGRVYYGSVGSGGPLTGTGGGGDDPTATAPRQAAARSSGGMMVSGGGDETVADPGYNEWAIPGGGATLFDQAGYDAAIAERDRINNTKAEREKLYGTVRENAYTAGKRGLDENREKAARDLRFELFAKGLNGGSEDVNQNALLGRTYDQGVLDLSAKADAAATSLRSSDEQTRLNLLQGIDSGMDQASILSSAANQLANNSDKATAEAQGTSIGDLFANAGLLSAQSQYRQGKAAGTDWWNTLSPGNSTVRTKASSGTVTAS